MQQRLDAGRPVEHERADADRSPDLVRRHADRDEARAGRGVRPRRSRAGRWGRARTPRSRRRAAGRPSARRGRRPCARAGSSRPRCSPTASTRGRRMSHPVPPPRRARRPAAVRGRRAGSPPPRRRRTRRAIRACRSSRGARRRAPGSARPVSRGGASRPLEREVHGLGAAAGEHDLDRVGAEGRGDLLARLLEQALRPLTGTVDRRGVPDEAERRGHRVDRLGPHRGGRRVIEVDGVAVGHRAPPEREPVPFELL